jgi:hypothetical protein
MKHDTPRLRELLTLGGADPKLAAQDIDHAELVRHAKEIQAQHGIADVDELKARAAYRCLTHASKRTAPTPAVVPSPDVARKLKASHRWLIAAWMIAVLLLLAVIAARAAPPEPVPNDVRLARIHADFADPQGGGGLIVQFQNGGSTIGTFVAFLQINCSTNLTCSASGTKVTITASSTASTAWSSITGSATNTATGFVLAPTATGTVPWTHTCPSGITVDCIDWNLGATKEMWIDSSGVVHFNQNPVGVGGAVSSVFGRTGAVTAQSGDYSYSQISGTPSLYYQTVDANGTAETQRPALNLVSGTNATVSCADNSGASRTDCTISASSSAGSTFDLIGTGTNTTATMTVGSGATLTTTGTGVNNATEIQGVAVNGTPGVGQIPIASSGTAAAWGDPIVSSAYTTLFNAQDATTMATSSAVRIPNFSGFGTLNITGAIITGSPSGCSIALSYQANTGASASSAFSTVNFTPANSYQSAAVTPLVSAASGDRVVAVYSCSTYPTAGTISVVFDPITPTAITNTPKVAQSGTWSVTATQSSGANMHVDVDSAPTTAVTGTVTSDIGTTGGLALDATLTGGTLKAEPYDGTNVIGTSTHPMRVDPTGTTTQPVSGTVTANAGTGTFNIQSNASVNLAQVNGSTVATAATGIAKVGLTDGTGNAINSTSNSLNVAVQSVPSNQSVNVAQVGGTVVVAEPCQTNAKSYLNINQTANAQLVAGTSGKKIYVCSINLVTATAQNIALVEGTGTTCGTGTAGVTGFGGSTAATGWNLAANGGLTYGSGGFALGAEGTAADNLCLFQSSTGQVSGGLSYVVQ